MNRLENQVYRIEIVKMVYLRIIAIFSLILLSLGVGRVSAQTSGDENVRSLSSKDYQIKIPGQLELQDDQSWWEARTESSPENSASWLGLYKVLRFKDIREPGKAISKKYADDLQKIEDRLREIDDNSYEYNLVAYENRFMLDEGFPYLEKARKLRPENADLQDDLAAFALFKGELSQMRIHLQQLKNSGKFNDKLMEFHRSLLKGLPANAILLSHGFADTYPLLMIQQLEGIRKDVELISIDHLLNEQYRLKSLQVAGIPLNVTIPSEPYLAIELLSELTSRKIYVATTFPEFWLKGHRSAIYFEGLAYRWSPELVPFESFDPTQYYKKHINPEQIDPNQPISRNYLPLLIRVRNLSKMTGRMSIAEETEAIIRAIAARSSKSGLILQKLEE